MKNYGVLIQNSLKFILQGPIDSFCSVNGFVMNRGQGVVRTNDDFRVNSLRPDNAYMQKWTVSSLVQLNDLSPVRHQAIT